jgi:membrane fusion protein (multidrug efflux system)
MGDNEGNRTHPAPQGSGTPPVDSLGRSNGVIAFLRARPRVVRSLVITAVVVLVAVVAVWIYLSGHESTDDAQIDGHITPIAARVGGTVRAVHVDDNEVVKVGAVLVEIDPTDYRVALQRAEADLAEARAARAAASTGVPITTTTTRSNLDTALAGVAAAKARMDSAQARLREAVATNDRLQRDLARMKELVAKDEVSRQRYDDAVAAAVAGNSGVQAATAAVTEAEQAKAQAAAALAQARTAPDQVAATRARLASAEARIAQAQATLEQARLNLEYTAVIAPSDGVVSRRSVEVGQVVQAGQPLLALVSLSDIWVTANFKETQLHHMRPGQAASISVDAYSRTYKGHVDSIAAATGARFSLLPPENATGNFVKVVQRVPVKIVWTDLPADVRPQAGLSADVTVYVE